MIDAGNFGVIKPDIFEEIRSHKGDLEEKDAQRLLSKLIISQPNLMYNLLTGESLFPFQTLKCKMFAERDFCLDVSSRGGAKCCVPNTYVISSQGIHYISELQEGDKIKAQNEMRGVFEKTINPPQKTLKMTTRSGFNIEGLPEHRIYVFDSEKQKFEYRFLKDLLDFPKNIHIPIQMGADQWGNNNPLDGWDLEYYLDGLRQPGKGATGRNNLSVDPEDLDFYYFLGLLIGDGTINKETITITTNDEATWQFLESFGKKILPTAKIGYKTQVGTTRHYNFCSKLLVDLLKYIGFNQGIKAGEKCIPESILKCSKEKICSLLAGYFDADGNVNFRKCKYSDGYSFRISSTSISKKLLYQIQIILCNLGIVCRIKEDKKSKGPKVICGKSCICKQAYILQVSSRLDTRIFHENIKLRLPYKQNQIDEFIKISENFKHTNSRQIPKLGKTLRKIKGFRREIDSWGPVSINRLINLKEKYLKHYNESEESALTEEIINCNFFFDQIDKFEEGFSETIDIGVEEDHCYWGNGFINHNSFTSAVFCIYYALCNPGTKILILGPGMRQSAIVLAYIMDIAKKPNAYLLRQFLSEENYKKSPERHSIRIGDSEVFAMSLGDGKKIRGARANVIILDEAFAIPSNIIDEVIGPMMVVPANINDILKTRKWEDRMIAAGKFKEEDRMIFKNNKMIMLSSACYEFEPLYKRFLDYKEKIIDPNFIKSEEYTKTKLTYGIVNLGWEALPDELLSKGFILGEKSRMSEDAFRREYEAQFSPDSSSYYKMSTMKSCCLQPTEYPTIELRGDSPAKYFYVLGIDPNYKNAENSDHFAMCLMKVARNKMNIGTVVHNYAMAGLDTDSIMKYIQYLLTHFNVEYMIVDSGGGISLIETLNNSSLFKNANIELGVVDFKFDELKDIKESKKQYDPKAKKMVHLQHFGGKWIQLANQELQMCFDHKKVRFASMPINSDYESLLKEDIPIKDIHFKLKQEEDLKGIDARYKMKEKQRQFIEHQMGLIDLTINECANVQLTTTAQGNQSFDLPTSMRKINTPDKPRKDSYTALLLANWGRKCVEIMHSTEEDATEHSWTPPIMF